MGFDLTELDTTKKADEGVWMEVEHPETAEPLGIHLKLLGEDSNSYQKFLRKHRDKQFKKGMKGLNYDAVENERLDLLTLCTIDWKGVQYNGEELELTKENVRWLYKTYRWIREQADEFIADRSNFLGE